MPQQGRPDRAYASHSRHAGTRRTPSRGPQGLVTCLALMIGAVISVWIVVSPMSHADGVTQPHQKTAASAKTTPLTTAAPERLAPAPKSVVGKPAAPAIQRWPYADKCPEKALACVDLKDKVSWLQVNGVVMYGPVRIEPGSPGQVTPTGVFSVDRKDRHHVSNEFNEPMPDAVFFAPGGIAFHVGSLTKGSHGCVHLSWRDANYYYQQLQIGATVAVF